MSPPLRTLLTRSIPLDPCVSLAVAVRAGPALTGFLQDIELEDDDDGSTTVTNSIINLAEPSVPVLTEELVAKLGSVTSASVEENKSFPEPPAEEPSAHGERTTVSPSDSRTSAQESASQPIPVDGLTPSEPSPDMTDSTTVPVCVDQKIAASIRLELVVEEDETLAGDDLPSQEDPERDVEPWVPDGEIPTIVISPPSEVDPEDELEPGYEEYEYDSDSDSELDYPGDYPVHPVPDVVPELPSSPVEAKNDPCRSPCRSPIICTGMLWSDDKGIDLGPLPFTEEIIHLEEIDNLEIDALQHPDTAVIAERPETADILEQNEAQVFAIEEGAPETITTTSEDSSGTCYVHFFSHGVC